MRWLPGVNSYRVPDCDWTEGWRERYEACWTAYAEAHRLMLEALLEVGSTVLAGADSKVPGMMPGFPMHEEMKAVEATGMLLAQVPVSAASVPSPWMGWNTSQIREV